MTLCSQLQAPHRFWIAVRSLHSPAWRPPWRTPLDGAVLLGSMWWHPYHTDSWTSFQEVLTCSPSSPGDSSSPLSLPSPSWVSLIQIKRRRRGRGGKKTWKFSYWANSTQKGGRNQVEKRRKTGDAQMERSSQHTDRTRGGREREQESAKAFSLPDLAQDLAQDLDRFGTRPKSRSPFSTTFLLFKDLVRIFIQSIHPWTYQSSHIHLEFSSKPFLMGITCPSSCGPFHAQTQNILPMLRAIFSIKMNKLGFNSPFFNN